MLLKPFSIPEGQDYKEFLSRNYMCRIQGHGLKKINLKGLNKIGHANDPEFENIPEGGLVSRKIEDIELTPSLITAQEKQQVADSVKTRFDPEQSKTMSFYETGASFSIELFDIVFIDEIKSGELQKGIEVIKDSMIFSEKGIVFESFVNNLETYERYLENPSDHSLLKNVKDGLERCIKDYEANPFAHFLLGLVFHRPTVFFDLERSEQSFLNSKKFSEEIEESYMKALSGFMLSWLLYLKKDYVKAIETLLQVADEEFLGMPEIYYNLSKFYAIKGDGVNAVKYLDEAVSRFDFFYTLKADADHDFDAVRNDVTEFFNKLRDEEKERVSEKLAHLGVTISPGIENGQKRSETETVNDRV